jgi:8-oxo-dGTP pyrophosphatase MutT (NUDIX family)
MELNTETVTTPPRDAATVVMLRDTDEGVEVFLLKRHGLSDVMGGAYVFPGGKVDTRDAEPGMRQHLDHAPTELHGKLGEPGLDAITAASLYVAAIREAFEESGILFVQNATPVLVARAGALLREGMPFDDVLAELALRLDTASVVPWSRWITPKVPTVSNKRFDTRFFVAAVPLRQVALHDNHEATESTWVTPRSALQRYWSGDIELAPPQIMSLAYLSHFASVDDVLQTARQTRPPVIAPEPFQQDGLRVVCYPGDKQHTVPVRVFPGPTRLTYRNKRFEPLNGFESLFDRAPGFFGEG